METQDCFREGVEGALSSATKACILISHDAAESF